LIYQSIYSPLRAKRKQLKLILKLIKMESDCCGASEWIEDTGICGACGEHADWNNEDED
jgi:hypothetical protein